MRRSLVGILALAVAVGCSGKTIDGGGGADGGPGGSDVRDAPSGSSFPFFLQSVFAVPLGVGGGCVFTPDSTQPTISKGILDVEIVHLFKDSYEAVFLAGNQDQANAKETSRITVEGATVQVTDSTGKQLAAFMTLGSASLAAPNGTTPGYGVVELSIVDSATVATLRAQLAPLEKTTIVTHTQAFGTTFGGEHIVSNVFEFAITACRGCLVAFDTDPARLPQPNCDLPSPTSGPLPLACFYGQDVPIDCHECVKDPFCLCGKASCPGGG
jgi:hypothetical protein